MKNIKYKVTNLIVSWSTIAVMAITSCATMDESSEKEEPAKIILFKDVESNKNLSNSERVCFNSALNDVREQEEQKYSNDAQKRKSAMGCFYACGGAFIVKDGKCKYIPSKYEFNNNTCLCNGQDIIPNKEKEAIELERQACQKICESANTDKIKYAADLDKISPFSECVCKKTAEDKQK